MKRTLALLLAALMLLGLMACASTPAETPSDAPATTTPTETPADEPADEPAETPTEEPADEPVEEPADAPVADDGPLFDEHKTFTIWTSSNVMNQPDITFSETDVWKVAQEKMNVTVKWEMVSRAAASEQFNLMMVSESYPEIIHGGNFSTQGYQYYIDEDIIIDMMPYIEQGYAPNYQALREADPQLARDSILDSGALAVLYSVLTTIQTSWKGPFAIADMAADAGINVDEVRTLDDYHDLLLAYKSQGLRVPYHMQPSGLDNLLMSAYNLGGGGMIGPSPFVPVDGKLQYSLITDAYYDYLTLVKSWYDEGLIETEFYGVAGDLAWDMDMLATGDYGLSFAATTMAEILRTHGERDYRAILAPVMNEGDVREIAIISGTISRCDSAMSTITTACTQIEDALTFLDYFYSEDMFYLANYGIQGVTWDFDENGDVMYTDLFINDENNWTWKSNMHAMFYSAGYLYDWEAQKIGQPESVIYAYDTFDKNYEDKYTLPNIALSTEEMESYASRYTDIQTYVGEMAIKFIIGQEELSPESYAAYVKNIEDMGIQQCIDAQQAAYDRYMSR